jgi:hypothetical protein
MPQEILSTLEALAILIVTGFLVPFIKAKTGEQKYARLKGNVETAVKAAEQLFGVKRGREKQNFVEEYIESVGFKVKKRELTALIESAVQEYFNKKQEELL